MTTSPSFHLPPREEIPVRGDLVEVGGRHENRGVVLDEDGETGVAVSGLELESVVARGVHGAAVVEGGLTRVQVGGVDAGSVRVLDPNSVRASTIALGPRSGGA